MSKVRRFTLAVVLVCDCGQERDLVIAPRPGKAEASGVLVAPCCLRVYRVVAWAANAPVLDCIGVERVRNGERKVVPVPSERPTAARQAAKPARTATSATKAPARRTRKPTGKAGK